MKECTIREAKESSMGSSILHAHWREYKLTLSPLKVESNKFIWQIHSYMGTNTYMWNDTHLQLGEKAKG